MATITDAGLPTLVDIVRRLKPGGGVETDIAELLSKQLPILKDIPWEQGNLDTGHRISSRTGLPSPTWRKLNQGIAPGKSSTAPYDETCGMMEALSKVDAAMAEMMPDLPAFRKTEDDAYFEGYAQEAARSIFYESTLLSPEKIHGLSPRYAATSGYTASGYVNKLGTVSGSNAQSIWIINWEPGRLYGIFPKNSVAGLRMEDLGKILTRDQNNLEFLAFVTHFKWNMGLAVQDYRYAYRLQWDPDDTAGVPDTGKTLYLALIQALNTIRGVGKNCRIYMSRVSKTKLDQQLAANSADYIKYLDLNGENLAHFQGIPIRIEETLVGETAVA